MQEIHSKCHFSRTRQQLEKLGLPSGDDYTLSPSNQVFDDGAHYRIEVPTINSYAAAKRLLELADRNNVIINRITETYGIFRHTKQEITNWIALCKDYGCELVMSQGPRATYDTGASSHTSQGQRIGYRLRGQEQIVRAIEDIKRALHIGVRSFLLYDEGLLYIMNCLRQAEEIPKEIKFKISAHCGYSNPASIKLLESMGANSINPVRDLQLHMLSAIRKCVQVPLDCHTDNPKSSGGFIRTYEVPEMIKLLSPLYLKSGNSALVEHGANPSQNDIENIVKQLSIVTEIAQEYAPYTIQSKNSTVGAA